ncbi:hypothetical protein ZHAS_00005279 [Anopheles sinensis]|uniref:Uncharacterized protein n=1 Tax=Anopheles sinensis TaxID=74873 RepID=A0A084VJ59_ANOSI|nr:hypothetical protein ZHAS_00005279 [Anopheles sinensis]
MTLWNAPFFTNRTQITHPWVFSNLARTAEEEPSSLTSDLTAIEIGRAQGVMREIAASDMPRFCRPSRREW